MRTFFLITLLLGYALLGLGQGKTVKSIQVPAVNDYCRIDLQGASVIPSGRLVTPAGKVLRIARGAFGLALSPDQQTALVLHNTGIITK
ncbi:MAG: hypothetical protein KBC60_08345, partial [Haliscomenobacter sp.]|nr:hypothetical protein [Haliscomenobacter sp.]